MGRAGHLHHGVVRRLYGLPRSSLIDHTRAEAGETSLSLRVRRSTLRHFHCMYLTPEGGCLVGRLFDRPHWGMGRRALEYAALVPEPPYCGLLQIPPHQIPGLEIMTTVPRIRSERNTRQSALHLKTAAMLQELLVGQVLLYTDGSVTADAGGLRVPNAGGRDDRAQPFVVPWLHRTTPAAHQRLRTSGMATGEP
ncbi:hypothetical protein MRX96_032357 [Rhipicephalus microplus]